MADETAKATGETTASAGADTGAKAGADSTKEKETQEKTYSQSDLDRVVSKMYERIKAEKDAEVEAERKRLEEEKLIADKKFKDLAENKTAELEALKAEVAAKKFEAEARAKLGDLELSDLAPLVLTRHDTIDDIAKTGTALKELIDKKVQDGINAAMDTGHRSVGSAAVDTTKKKPSEMTAEEWTAEKKRLGLQTPGQSHAMARMAKPPEG